MCHCEITKDYLHYFTHFFLQLGDNYCIMKGTGLTSSIPPRPSAWPALHPTLHHARLRGEDGRGPAPGCPGGRWRRRSDGEAAHG